MIIFPKTAPSSNNSTLEREVAENKSETEAAGEDADTNIEKPMTVILRRTLFNMHVYS